MSNRPNHKTLFYMLRHGQTPHNVAGVISDDDAPLTDTGIKQAEAAQPLLTTLFPDSEKCYAVRSALPRAGQTAEMAAPGLQWHIDDRLNEIHNGDLGGKITSKEAMQFLSEWKSGTRPRNKTVERHPRHAARVVLSVLDHLKQCPEHQTPLFVSHGLSMQRTAEALGIEGRSFKNATLYCFEYDENIGRWGVSEVLLKEGKVEKGETHYAISNASSRDSRTGMGLS